MGVAVETELRELVGKIRHRVEAIGHVVPVRRLVERAVDDGEIGNLADHAQAREPLALLVGKLEARPFQRGGGHRIHGVQRVVSGGVLVMISLHRRAIHRPDFFQTSGRIRIIADDIPHADVIRDVLL